jgi:hypothetical protein
MVTRSLSSDLNPFNITVISIHPGMSVSTISHLLLFIHCICFFQLKISVYSPCYSRYENVCIQGWVRTDMGGPNAPLSSQESIESLISTLKELTFDKSGLFFNQNGEEIPW